MTVEDVVKAKLPKFPTSLNSGQLATEYKNFSKAFDAFQKKAEDFKKEIATMKDAASKFYPALEDVSKKGGATGKDADAYMKEYKPVQTKIFGL